MTNSAQKQAATILIFILVLLLQKCMADNYQRTFSGQGNFGAVSSGHPLATHAGIKILEQGGNAIDAAIAVAFVLGVTDFSNSGLGGDGFALIHLPGGNIHAWDASISRPAEEGLNYIGIPTIPEFLLKLHRIYGTKSREKLLAPAVNYAQNGFKLDSYIESVIRKSLIKKLDQAAIEQLCPNGIPLISGQLFKQPALASTLKDLSENGTAGFYHGNNAKLLIRHMNKLGSKYSQKDLAGYRSKLTTPVKSSIGPFEIFGTPLPSSSVVTIKLIKELVSANYHLSPKSYEEYSDISSINRKYLDHKYAYLTSFIGNDQAYLNLETLAPQIKQGDDTGDRNDSQTTHLCVWDKNGYIVTMTLTLGSHFGTGNLSPLGFFYNNEMRNFTESVAKYPKNYPANFGPLSSKSPIIIKKHGVPVLAIGGAGSNRIITNTALNAAAYIKDENSLGKTLLSPRFFMDYKNVLQLEWSPDLNLKNFPDSGRSLSNLRPIGDDYFGLVTAIASYGNQLHSYADFRRNGSCGNLSKIP